jgi:hypothetical protein
LARLAAVRKRQYRGKRVSQVVVIFPPQRRGTAQAADVFINKRMIVSQSQTGFVRAVWLL